MSKPISALTQFQNQTGPIPLSQLDADLASLWNASNDMATYSNYLIDSSGAPNSITVTPAAGLAFAYTAGIWIEVKIANTNTSTTVNINVAALGNVAVKNPDGSNPAVGQLVVGGIYAFQHDGTNFQIIGGPTVTPIGKFSDGTAAAPSITFASDTVLGLYKAGTDILGFANAGSATGTLSSTVLTMPALAVTGSTVPANGVYLSAANTLGFSTNTTSRGSINATGNWSISAPSSGTALSITPAVGGIGIVVPAPAGNSSNITLQGNGVGTASGLALYQDSGNAGHVYNGSNASLDLSTNATQRVLIGAAGNVTVNAPASGTALTITPASGATGIAVTSSVGNAANIVLQGNGVAAGAAVIVYQDSSAVGHVYNGSNSALDLSTNATQRVLISAAGNVTVNAPASGVATTINGVSGTHSTQISDSATALFDAGYLDIPQNAKAVSYQLVLSDRGKGIDFNGTSLTCTIPANGTVAFPNGSTIVITNLNATSLSIAITTDTLTLAGTTTTGTRTLAQNGTATIRKVLSTSWIIAGTGLT